MVLERAICHGQYGDLNTYEIEMTDLSHEAIEHGDDVMTARVLSRLSLDLAASGDNSRTIGLGEQALEAAERAGHAGLQVEALCAIGRNKSFAFDLDGAEECLQRASQLALPEDVFRQIMVHLLEFSIHYAAARYSQAFQAAQQGLQLARAAGMLFFEARFLGWSAISSNDMALTGSLQEQAFSAFQAAGSRIFAAQVISNSSGWWSQIGLYRRGLEAARQAVQYARELGNNFLLLYSLQFMAMALIELGEFASAQTALEEAVPLAPKQNDHVMETVLVQLQAQVALYQGEIERAFQIQKSFTLDDEKNPHDIRAQFLAYQAAAARLSGRNAEARRLAEQALALIEPEDFGVMNAPMDEALFWCYRALGQDHLFENGELSDEMWQVLELAKTALLSPVENMSDAGLRRGYLHRVRYRRLLVREWLRHAPGRVSPEVLKNFANQVQRPGRLNDVFRRLLEAGVRLNAQRDPERLPAEIVEKVSELTGAERIALLLFDEEGKRRTAGVQLPSPLWQVMTGTVEAPSDPETFVHEIEPWLEEAASSQIGFVRTLYAQSDITMQRSLLTAPLLSQGRLVGLIYCDLSGCFGRFEQEDLDLLGVLANQSAVAVENADWSATLENRVTERTTNSSSRMTTLSSALPS